LLFSIRTAIKPNNNIATVSIVRKKVIITPQL
jgi:hypothetical protein